ncbi:MAG: amino acid ABC transporter ATP-binding protein [Butyrivibrio sp.]|nr:amino acid ABC transporter ATP-binding protein [Butyrivibrio sp.]
MLEVKNIRKKYNDLEILKGVDLRVEKGNVDVILGQSGSGKTTLLRCIDILENADAGEITIGDVHANLSHLSQREAIKIRRRMSFVFQNYGLFKNKTALENVMLGLNVVRGVSKKEAENIAKEAIDKVGLLDRLDHYPSQLSGGQQQRIGIARAFATSPEVILMDEPTASLDPGLVGEVLTTIENLANSGVTMLIVTHELSFARKVASNVMFMDDGVVIESAPTKDFFLKPTQEKTIEFLRKSSPDYGYMI